jgi:hypothetical protein
VSLDQRDCQGARSPTIGTAGSYSSALLHDELVVEQRRLGAEQQVQERLLDVDLLALVDHERRIVQGDDLARVSWLSVEGCSPGAEFAVPA